ncbi:hypothetical protein [Massilia soli]|uniref:Uncharacterized protein n=1 Tax=Massilia soli TaxID=2792854 RepID=A0ABS7SUD8_9BURK|nr:hypothetical protein [Massilia soli]MBZ2209534.1 hypothetical protein [Massilia soli]
MQKLISELSRLYLPAGAVAPDALAEHMLGKTTLAVPLVSDSGMTRALMIPFRKAKNGGDEARHWTQLCALANALQADLGLPAPAVSISGADGYGLWLSFADPVPASAAQQFLALLGQAYFPDTAVDPAAVNAPVELPPCLNQASGKWAAFIHPGMGASFADESGLEMAPPMAGQLAFLEGLHSISEDQFRHALAVLQPPHSPAPAPRAHPAAAAEGLLLKDATLEDIVRFLHSKKIEPTFRHLI